jgi:hypothetical protein
METTSDPIPKEELFVSTLTMNWDKSIEEKREKEFVDEIVNQYFSGDKRAFESYCIDNLPEKYVKTLEKHIYAISGLTISQEEFEELGRQNALRFAREWDESIENGREKEFIRQMINELFAGEKEEFESYCKDNLPEKYLKQLESYIAKQ